MSEEKREILEHLVEYLQQKIDSGEHKIFFNDLMWDEKTIDCINAINNTLEEIERLNKRNKEIYEGFMATTKELTKYAEEVERLNNIINKAIEYLESYNTDFKHSRFNEAPISIRELGDLLDILKGSDKE